MTASFEKKNAIPMMRPVTMTLFLILFVITSVHAETNRKISMR